MWWGAADVIEGSAAGASGLLERPGLHQAVTRSFAAAVGSFCVGALVCVVTFAMVWFDLGPIHRLLLIEEQAYQRWHIPAIEAGDKYRPVIFVDIDQAAIDQWNEGQRKQSVEEGRGVGAGSAGMPEAGAPPTPRRLIAALVRSFRELDAAVIFLDFDFRGRNGDADDEPLQVTLGEPGSPVLLPHYFTPGPLPACSASPEWQKGPLLTELSTVFDANHERESVAFVHGVITGGGDGSIDSICSAFPVRRQAPQLLPAAMVEAVALADAVLDGHADLTGRPQSVPVRWFVDNDTQQVMVSGMDGKEPPRLAYLRLKASRLMKDGVFDTKGASFSKSLRPIVIVGGTGDAAGDAYATPLGEMPGGLIHANAAIGLQVPEEGELPILFALAIELLILLVATYFVWRRAFLPFYRLHAEADEASLPAVVRLHLYFEGWVLGAAAVTFCVFWALPSIHGQFPRGWHLGIASVFLGVAASFAIHLIILSVKAVEAVSEHFAERRLRWLLLMLGRSGSK